MEIRNSVVVITGASSGFGEATARQCAAQGARLVLAARSSDKLATLEQQIIGAGGQALAVPTDVSQTDQVQHLAEAALAHYGRVDVLVNNAGFGVLDAIPEARLADLEEMIQVNLLGVARCTQALLPHMLARKQGQIINVASLAGLLATPNFAFYSATKFALIGMTRVMQLDLHGSGVRCALICPGAARTPFMDRADVRKYKRVTRLMPWLTANDVARAIVRAIKTDSSGEILLPRIATPLIRLANLIPGVARVVVRLIG